MAVLRFFPFLQLLIRLVIRLNYSAVFFPLSVFPGCGNAGGCNLIPGRYHSILIFSRLDRPYENSICCVLSLLVKLRFHYISHSCLRIYQRISVSIRI